MGGVFFVGVVFLVGVFFFCFCLWFFLGKVSLCTHGCPRAHSVDSLASFIFILSNFYNESTLTFAIFCPGHHWPCVNWLESILSLLLH